MDCNPIGRIILFGSHPVLSETRSPTKESTRRDSGLHIHGWQRMSLPTAMGEEALCPVDALGENLDQWGERVWEVERWGWSGQGPERREVDI